MAEKGPSLEEVLRGIPPERLDQPCTDKHLCEVAHHVTNWLILAPFLGISRAEEREIVANWPRNTAKQKIEFLRKWQEKRGRKATYRRLCKAFVKVGEVTLAENVCEIVANQGSSSSECSDSQGSGLNLLLTDTQRQGSTVHGALPTLEPVGSTPTSLRPTVIPPPTGDDPLDTVSKSRGSELSTPHHHRQHPRTSKIAQWFSFLPSMLKPRLWQVERVLDPYGEYLRDMYSRICPPFLLDQWPPPPTRKVFNLAMIHITDVQCGPVDEELVRLLQRGNVAAYTGKRRSVELNDLFNIDNQDRKIVLVEGAPGSGKSTLAWHACQRWKARELFQQFRMVVFVPLRDPWIQSALSIADLLPAGSEQRRRDAAEGIRACGGKGVLFVMDGWDEFGPDLKSNSIVSKLICNSDELEVPYSALLITSRPIASASLQPLASSRVEIVGFTPDEVHQYFQEAVRDTVAMQALQEQLKELPVIEASCYLPLIAAIVAHIFLGLNHTLPRTLHGVFSQLVCGCIIRYLTKQSGDIPEIWSLGKLPPEVQAPFENMCLLAYEASMKNKATFTSEDLSSYGVSVEGSGLGLLQGVQSFLAGKSYSYHFLHLSVQELLAAVHVSKLEASEQVRIFREVFSEPRLVAMFRSYAALTKLETEGIREVVASVIVGTRPSSEDIVYGRPNTTQWKQHVLNILRCLYEAEDISLCLFVASLLDGSLALHRLFLSPLDWLCIGYFLRCVCVGREGEFEVNLQLCRLDGYGVSFIIKELGKCVACSGGVISSVSSNAVIGRLGLDLGYNIINGSDVHSVCELMKSNPSVIRKLNLSVNEIQDGEDGLLCLLRVLCSNYCIVEVRLFDCNLRIDGANGPMLAEMLRTNVTLKVLDLRVNDDIGDVGLGYIVAGMIENRRVVKMELARCGIGEEGGKFLRRMLTENRTLECLDISVNGGLGDAGIMEVGEGLKVNSGLQELKISDCGYSLNGLKEFVLCLKENSHLRRLVVWREDVESVVEERAAVNYLRRQRGEVELEIV